MKVAATPSKNASRIFLCTMQIRGSLFRVLREQQTYSTKA
ncbi:hypothetical protein B4065_1543 [Caldibacillus thermoamylovorans]|nr:hypothetical protein B4065_1543 [Caldibacillus thermoamylovorans]